MTTRLAFALPLFLALVSGCGSGEDAIEGARNQPNHFAGVKNPVDDFSSGSTGDSSNTSGLASNEVRITLELPTALAPDGEATRRNLRIVQPERIAIYRTDPSLQNLGGVDGVSTRTDAEGYTIITFEGGQPLAPDIVIEASYGNTRLRRSPRIRTGTSRSTPSPNTWCGTSSAATPRANGKPSSTARTMNAA